MGFKEGDIIEYDASDGWEKYGQILSNNKDGTYRIQTKDDLILETWPDYAIKSTVVPSCHDNHELVLSNTSNSTISCSACEENTIPIGIQIFNCHICSWNCCKNCYNLLQKQKKQREEKNINHRENIARKSFCNEKYLTSIKSDIAAITKKKYILCQEKRKIKIKKKTVTNNIQIEENKIRNQKKIIAIHNNEKNINHKENI